ncbi:hypothetical protein AB6806_27530 [Bosea sp. RCC_152_1]|uniref:hypothetical protein n=1 Tax=Bosea sp. RCC_152_1 TaxID=3239228 RepID=UPI003525F38D
MSETEITDAPKPPAIDPAVAEILLLFGDRVESVTVSTVSGDLRRETRVGIGPSSAALAELGLPDSVNQRVIRNMKPLVR